MPWALFKPHESLTHPTKRSETLLKNVKFNIFKFNNRPRPKIRQKIVIIGCFSEFGCETVGVTYCIPRLIKNFPGMYIIAMGWHGRDFLYKHLVDEFWAIDEEFMHLRNRTFAFHHKSDNLKHIEEAAAFYGTVIPSAVLGKYAVNNSCRTCGYNWTEWKKTTDRCAKCTSTNIVLSLFGDAESYKKTATRIPFPSAEKMEWARSKLNPRTVGIFARSRTTYGRNLSKEYYINLVKMVESFGYDVVWLGEKQSTMPCPVDHVWDFSRSPESEDLEKTLALICHCDFTIQYWTASSRLAGLMGVPFLLFESPEQVFCTGTFPGQEGRRLELTTFGERKIVLADYLKSVKDENSLLSYTEHAIKEMRSGDYSDKITDLVSSVEFVKQLRENYIKSIKK